MEEKTKDPVEAQLPKGLRHNQGKHEESKNRYPGLWPQSRVIVLWRKRNSVSSEDSSLCHLSPLSMTCALEVPGIHGTSHSLSLCLV